MATGPQDFHREEQPRDPWGEIPAGEMPPRDVWREGPPDEGQRPPARPPARSNVPFALFIITCVTTYMAGGPAFAGALMFTLTAHEFGHYLQARRYGVPATLPYFIPMPAGPIGTMGAVIFMQPGMGNRRSLFDIAISGPLAGLVPALVFTIVGLQWSQVVDIADIPADADVMWFGRPLLFQFLIDLTFGPLDQGQFVGLHPLAKAGWVGIFITALNLIPIGQLDGGHILYALLLRRAHMVAKVLLYAAAAAMVLFGYWGWILMIFLLMLMGPVHPPTANDYVPLGRGRTILGWITLLFIIIGFTPTPFQMRM